jgi:hypothetical protein
MEAEQKVATVQLSVRLRDVSPPVTPRLRVAEQTSQAELHAALQVAFGWSDGHLYTFRFAGGGSATRPGLRDRRTLSLSIQTVHPVGDWRPHRSERFDPRCAAGYLRGGERRSSR